MDRVLEIYLAGLIHSWRIHLKKPPDFDTGDSRFRHDTGYFFNLSLLECTGMASCFGLFGVNSEFNDFKDHRLYHFLRYSKKTIPFWGATKMGMGPYIWRSKIQLTESHQNSPIFSDSKSAQELMVRCFRIWQSERLEQQTLVHWGARDVKGQGGQEFQEFPPSRMP